MIKKNLIIIFIFLLFNNISYAAESSSDNDFENSTQETSGDPKKVSEYKMAIKFIKKAKKYLKKGKTKKAKIQFEKALKYLYIANEIKPNADIFNNLGYATRNLGDYKNAEIYYKLGLSLDPNHFGINEYLGELYVETNRIDKAKKILAFLKNCNCKEFEELNNVIKSGKSKY
jgi:tetratricopeptide (TPR) repeat protein